MELSAQTLAALELIERRSAARAASLETQLAATQRELARVLARLGTPGAVSPDDLN